MLAQQREAATLASLQMDCQMPQSVFMYSKVILKFMFIISLRIVLIKCDEILSIFQHESTTHIQSLAHLVQQNAMASSIDPQAIQQLYRARYPQMTNEQLNQATRAYIMQVNRVKTRPNQSSPPLPRSCIWFVEAHTGGEFTSITRGAKQWNFDSFYFFPPDFLMLPIPYNLQTLTASLSQHTIELRPRNPASQWYI